MSGLRSIVVCVEYDDCLTISYLRNHHHFIELLVVTSPHDQRTIDFCARHEINCYKTDAFYRNGAAFDKGAAIEAALEAFGRYGWILLWDADILLPREMPDVSTLDPQRLYGARRRILNDVTKFRLDLDWKTCPVRADRCIAGYFQLFHAEADAIRDVRPWYDSYAHAGCCDHGFELLWPRERKGFLPGVEVLHLGPCFSNWFGRATPRLDGREIDGADQRADQMRTFLQHGGEAARNAGRR